MKRAWLIVIAGMLAVSGIVAAPSVLPWTPIYQGVDHATGTNEAGATGQLSVNALRIDLQNPDIRLFVTPPMTNNYVPNSRETELQKPREFLEQYRLQVAINAVHFNPGGYSLPSGTAANLHGLTISTGAIVSAQNVTNDALCALLFTTNNQATFIYNHWPPVSTDGIYNAVAGMYPLLRNGVNISYDYLNAQSDTLHRPQPRTAFGLSEDSRYLILMTIDGRQNDFSDGAYDWETAEFLLLFGAWNGMSMDGGGSTCMVQADACGDSFDLNQNSFQFAVGRPGDQRPTGCNFGVFARRLGGSGNPGVLQDVQEIPGRFDATITWTTVSNALSQVEYGPTESMGTFTPMSPIPDTSHSVTLTGLQAGSRYYYRAITMVEGLEYSQSGCLNTTNFDVLVFEVTNQWKYTTQNLDGINWTARDYDDSHWLGSGPGNLYAERRTNPPDPPPQKNTPLPLNPATGNPFVTYYFRTHFNFPDSPAGAVLSLTNYLDDGAVFYLNGAEVWRAYMPPTPTVIANSTIASGYPCTATGNATCPYGFSLSGDLIATLVTGDNVLAVEVHNYNATSPDITFGASLVYRSTLPPPPPPKLEVSWSGTEVFITWPGIGFVLQEAPTPDGGWFDVPETASTNQVNVSPTETAAFYRLRNP